MLGGTKKVMLLYGNGRFSPASKDKDSVSKGSMKRAARRHMPTKSASEFRTSSICPFCQQADLVPNGGQKDTNEQYSPGLAYLQRVQFGE